MATQEITIPKKEIAPGVFTTGGIATAPQTVDATKIGNVPPIQPTTAQPKVDGSVVAGAETMANQIEADYQRSLDMQNKVTGDTSTLDNATKALKTAGEALGGRGQETITTEQQFGIPEKNKELSTLNADILAKNAEYQQANSEYEKLKADLEAGAGRRGLTTAQLTGQQGAVTRAQAAELNRKASDIGLLQARALGLQGQIESAQNAANRAIDLKYQDREQEYKIKLDQYNLIKDQLTGEQAKRGKALEYALNQEARKLEEQKAEEKAVQSMGITLAQNQAPQSIINRVNQAKSVKEIMSIPGISKYLLSTQDRLDIAIKQQTLQEKRDAAKAAQDALKSGIITKEQAEKATELRKEYNQLEPVKSLDKSETDTKAILNALKGGKPTDDIAAINSFQRIAVDPGVSVREGDVALLQTANSFGDKAWLRTNGYMVGNKLTPAARTAMQELTLKIHDSRIGSAIEKTAPIQATAKVYGIDFNNYVASPKKNSQQLLEEVTAQQVTPEVKAASYVDSISSQLGGNNAFSNTPFGSLLTPNR